MLTPNKGTIISTSTGLVIRLKNGARVKVAKQKNLKIGDTCYVLYNYTNMSVRYIWTEKEMSDYGSDETESEVVLQPTWAGPEDCAVNS